MNKYRIKKEGIKYIPQVRIFGFFWANIYGGEQHLATQFKFATRGEAVTEIKTYDLVNNTEHKIEYEYIDYDWRDL